MQGYFFKSRFLLVCTLASFFLGACAFHRLDPETADLHLRLGTSYLSKGDNPRALKELMRAAELNPKSEKILNHLGLAYYFRGKPKLAIVQLKRALEIKPSYSEARNNLARVYIDLGYYNEAIALLNVVLKDLTYTEPHKARANLGLAYFKKEQFATASENFLKAIQLHPENCYAYSYYGRSLFEMRLHSEAEKVLERAIHLCRSKNFPEPHFFSGFNYYKMGNRPKAKLRWEEVMNYFPLSEHAKKAKTLLQSTRSL